MGVREDELGEAEGVPRARLPPQVSSLPETDRVEVLRRRGSAGAFSSPLATISMSREPGTPGRAARRHDLLPEMRRRVPVRPEDDVLHLLDKIGVSRPSDLPTTTFMRSGSARSGRRPRAGKAGRSRRCSAPFDSGSQRIRSSASSICRTRFVTGTLSAAIVPAPITPSGSSTWRPWKSLRPRRAAQSRSSPVTDSGCRVGKSPNTRRRCRRVAGRRPTSSPARPSSALSAVPARRPARRQQPVRDTRPRARLARA